MNSNLHKKQEVELWEVVTPTVKKEESPQKRAQPQRKRNSQNGVQPQRKRSPQSREQRQRMQSTQSKGQQQKRRKPQEKEVRRGNVQLYEVKRVGNSTAYRGRPVQSIKRRKAKKRRAYFYRCLALLMVVMCLAGVFLLTGIIYRWVHGLKTQDVIQPIELPILSEMAEPKVEKPEIAVDLLEVNDYSRPGTELKKIKNIFVHYTANPGTSAAQNRSYFANLALTQERSASAHFIIGYEGEIIQCIPLEEQAYAVMTRNEDSVSIECCYLDENGAFTQETYDSLIHLLAWLTQEYHLESKDILRHYDCGGKLCPLYYAEHEDAWEQLLKDVDAYTEEEAQNL